MKVGSLRAVATSARSLGDKPGKHSKPLKSGAPRAPRKTKRDQAGQRIAGAAAALQGILG